MQAGANGRHFVRNRDGGRQYFGYRNLGILISAIARKCLAFNFREKRALHAARLLMQALMLA